ncbi:trypsin 3A1-like [Sabethes cyaneus]|uniref:trypsin 3A1-like n=1 Tax=Sabethes cyaneus TaxID=53552 RepID=UPI00237E3B90|nr:trypsin 3A1-like [Sabethes cyaneus]
MEIREYLLVFIVAAITDNHSLGGRVVPYKAVIEYKGSAYCGGSVIETAWILTAARCVMNKTISYLTVRLGCNSLNEGGVLYGVKSTHVHPKHNPETAKRALALLKLSTTLKFSSTVSSIPLVKPGYGMEEGTGCSIPSSIANITEIKAKLWTREKCQTDYPSAVNFTDDALCAKITTANNNTIQCNDNQHQPRLRFMLGSPLVCEGKQVAIVSRLGVESMQAVAMLAASTSAAGGVPEWAVGQCGGDPSDAGLAGQSFAIYGRPDYFTDVAFGNKWIDSLTVRRKRKPGTGPHRRRTSTKGWRNHRNGAPGVSGSVLMIVLVVSGCMMVDAL